MVRWVGVLVLAACAGTGPAGGAGGGSSGTGGGSAAGGGAAGGGSASGGGLGGGGGSADAGCSPMGVWTASRTFGPVGNTGTVTATLTDGITTSLTVTRTGAGLPDVRVNGTFTLGGERLVMTNTSVTTTDTTFDACIGVAGTYTATFPDCQHLALTVSSDPCASRTLWASGATLTKQ